MNIQDINLKPLEGIAGARNLAWKHYAGILFSIIGFTLVLLLTKMYILALLPFAYFIYTITFVLRDINGFKSQNWRMFGRVNDWLVVPALPEDIPPSLRPGRRKHQSNVVEAWVHSNKVRLLVYQSAQGYFNANTYYFTIAVVPLNKQFPHIVLDGIKNGTSVRNISKGYQTLELEGNFNKTFRLYMKKGEQIDVLSIITPDVMETLLQHNATQDIEIDQDRLYFISHTDKRNPEDIRELFDSIEKLIDEVVQRAQSLHYTPTT